MKKSPSELEYKLVAKCLLESGILIGSPEEIWSHISAWNALDTFRECIVAITELIGGRHSVVASFVKACVMQADGIDGVPYALDDIAEFLVKDNEARAYWQLMCSDEKYPHRCPHCGAAAFIGFLQIDCKARCPSGR